MRRGRWLALAALSSALTACGSTKSSSSAGITAKTREPTSTAPSGSSAPSATASAPAGAETVSASAGGVTATMHGSSHHPRVGLWPVHFTVTRLGHPARAAVSYEFLFAGQVVARRSHYIFTGSFSDRIEWPADAVGYPLTLRAVITAGRTVLNLDYPVQVSR